MESSHSNNELFKDWTLEDPIIVLAQVRKCISESQNEREVLRALEIAFDYTIKHFTVTVVEDDLFISAYLASKKIIEDRLKNLEKDRTSCAEGLCVCLQIITFFERVFKVLGEKGVISIILVKNFLMITLEVLYCCLSHCKISQEVYGNLFSSLAEHLSNFFKKCCDLLEQILNFLTTDTKCDFENESEVAILDKVMTFLSKLGLILINLEIKTMAKVWKTFVSVIENHLCLRENYNIEETLKDLCHTITTSMEAILCEGNQDVGKIIKLNCFLLKLIVKFCNVFAGSLRHSHNSVLNLLLMLCRWDAVVKAQPKFQTKEMQDLLNQLTIGTEPLLSLLMRDEQFIKEIHNVYKNSKLVEFPVLCCLILKKLIDCDSATRSMWFNENNNILMWVFSSTSSSEFIFTKVNLPSIVINGIQTKFTDLYEYVLVSTSAFLMTTRADEYYIVEKILIKNVLQTNPIKALLAIDIWCLLARFADSELCFAQILSLGKMLLEIETLRVEKWYLMSLIRRLFLLLSPSHKELFFKSFPTSFYSTLWEECRFDALTPNVSTHIQESVLSQVDHVLNVNEKTSRRFQGEKFENRILNLWKFNCEVLVSSAENERFIKILCDLTASVISVLPSEDLLMVLTQIKKLLSIGQPTCIQLYFTHILKSLSKVFIPPGNLQKKIITVISQIFRLLLSSQQVLSKQKTFETFYTFSHVTYHGEIISLSVQDASELKLEVMKYFKKTPPDQTDFDLHDYFSKLCQVGIEHVCLESSSKKAESSAVDLNRIFLRWKEDGKRIVEFFQLLSESEKREIKNLSQSILYLAEN